MRWWILVGALAGCGGGPTASPACTALCRVLVTDCAIEAYPGTSSCLQGCAVWESEGAAVEAYADCAADASCALDALLTCEHEHGPGLIDG